MRELDRYELLETLANGSLGNTHRAYDTRRRQVVLLKVLQLDRLYELSTTDIEGRFQSLTDGLRRLTHPGIVQLVDCHLDGRKVYLASEFVDGESIDNLVRRELPDPGRVVAYAEQMLEALEFAHDAGIIHQDLKPRNVIVDPDGRVRITDFGLAPFGARCSQNTGLLVGSMEYMAPEQFRGDDPVVQTDLHAVGVLLYQMVTGKSPFADPRNLSMHLVIESTPLPPSRVVPGSTAAFDRVISRALEKGPYARYSSAHDMRRALLQATQGIRQTQSPPRRPTIPPPPSPVSPTTAILDRRTLSKPAAPNPAVSPAVPAGAVAPAVDLAEIPVDKTLFLPKSLMPLMMTPAPAAAARLPEPEVEPVAPSPMPIQVQAAAPVAAAPMADAGSGRYRVVAARPLTSEIERHAGLVLNRYLGPIATVICRRAAGQANDEAHYFDLLAGHLRSGTERARFLDDVQRHRH